MTQRCRFSGRAGLATAAVAGRPTPRPPPDPPPARGVSVVVRGEVEAPRGFPVETLPVTAGFPVVGVFPVVRALPVVRGVPVGLPVAALPARSRWLAVPAPAPRSARGAEVRRAPPVPSGHRDPPSREGAGERRAVPWWAEPVLLVAAVRDDAGGRGELSPVLRPVPPVTACFPPPGRR